jgi:ferrous iron transport protein B
MVQMDTAATADVLIGLGGWTLLTGINLMLFSLMHNPCSTTILTIYRETKSLKWTTVATLMPVALGLTTTTLITWTARLIGWA